MKANNFVAKHQQTSGAGAHDIKSGKKSKRAKQKQALRRQLKTEE